MTKYVNVTIEQSKLDKVPPELPRHYTYGEAWDHQVEEGFPRFGAALVIAVDNNGRNLGEAID